MDLQTLRGQALALLAEDGTGYIQSAEVDDWLREGQIDVADKTGALRASATAQGIAIGTARYALPDDLLRAVLVTWAGVALAETTLSAAVTEPTNGTPTKYAVWGSDVILSPVPDAVDVLEIHYVRMPTAMQADTDPSGLPSDLEPLLVLYARAKAMEKDEKYNEAQALWTQYLAGAALGKERRGGVRPPVQWAVSRR